MVLAVSTNSAINKHHFLYEHASLGGDAIVERGRSSRDFHYYPHFSRCWSINDVLLEFIDPTKTGTKQSNFSGYHSPSQLYLYYRLPSSLSVSRQLKCLCAVVVASQ